MMKFIYLSVLFFQVKCQNVGIFCSDESGIPCLPEKDNKVVTEQVHELNTLPRRDPGKVGDIAKENVGDGRIQTLITRAIIPPIFELPDFLTHEECDHITKLALTNGMGESTVFTEEANISLNKSRRAQTTFIAGSRDNVLRRIQNRAIALTKLPKDIIYDSEFFQIGLYHVGGFYKFHYDSHPVSRETLMKKPCCQHVPTPHMANKCTICRYVTILMYLNHVEEGGETAFPLADQPDSVSNKELRNMTDICANAPVVVAPKKGKAVMWYNNIIDPEYGWLGVHDACALHGGCPILKGDKWISNLWINAPQHHSVNKKTVYRDEL